ncbi:MAG: hypothetical protein ACOY90_00575 [Candidatus Zhuqueibacterota bacterium]
MSIENYSGLHSVAVDNETNTSHHVSDADMISLESVVSILVKKGICTREELLALEEEIRHERIEQPQLKYMNIQNVYDRGRFPGLKRSMSKYRWSRRLGTLLFGWKWKKVKKN